MHWLTNVFTIAFMEVEHSNRYGVLTIPVLEAFERLIGHRLPSDYRQFLLAHNGGKPIPSHFDFRDGSSGSHLHHVLGLHNGPSYLQLQNSYEVYRGRMPAEMIAIADDDFGNAICIGISGPREGKVLFWDHEGEADDGAHYWGNVAEIAATFSEFLDGLYEWINPEETELQRAIRTDDVAALEKAISAGVDLEAQDKYGRTMIERAAIQNSTKVIAYLHGRGAKLRDALQYAKQNAEFFEEHRRAVKLIESLMHRTSLP